MKISACILTGLSCAALCALGDPIVIGVQVPGSDHASAPCTPTERTDDYHKGHFSADISGSQGKSFDVVLFGDSITDFWNNPSLALDGDSLNYAAAFNMGIGSDRVQNLLWRLRNGALDGYTTKYFTLMVGINNGHQKCIDHNERADRAEDVAESIRLMLCEMATKHPEAKILLMPILPYSFDSKHFEAAEVTEMSEAVNDYILRFVDNRRVFWVDLRSRYLQQNSMPDKVCYREGGHGGYDAVGLCLHPEFFTYSDFWKPALTNAMRKYLSVPAGQAHVADPSIGYAKAAPNVDGAGSATITVFGINLGTDANANAVTSYSIDYELDGGAKTRALSGQTGTRASFVIPDVALGAHTCRVTVTTADNRELVTLLDFSMTEPWYASPLPTDDSAVRTDGTLKYAYAPSACTVNGVQFAAAGNGNAAASGDIDWPYNMTSGASAPGSISGAYYEFLNRCWWANQGDKAVTLKNLTAGRSYLVQIFGYRNYNGDGKAHVWIRESYWDPNFIRVYGDGWPCGGTLTGTFTATGSTKTFTVTSDGNYGINGIQVRELGASGESTDVPPGGGEADGGGSDTGASDETDDAGGSAGSAGSGASPPFRASTPAARLDAWWAERHAEKAAAAADVSVKKDIVFLGDGLTQGWETTGAASLASHFTGDKAMFNLGFNGDSTENVLWRIRNGELGSHKAVFLMVGGNNSAIYTETEEAEGKTYLGVRSIIDCLCEHVGADKVVVQAVLPRGLDESDPVRPRNDRLNIDVRAYARQKGCAWVDMSDLFLEADRHTLKTSLFNADRVTLNASGYEVWAQAISPYVDAASGGTAMPADLVATARPVIDCIAAFPTATNAVMQDAFWRKFDDDLKLIGENGRNLDLVLLGDSLTQKWMEESGESMKGIASSILNLGRTGDFVENLLWRLEGGCIDGYTTKFFNLLIGTNNTIQKNPSDTPEDIAAGVRAVLDLVLEKHPESKILLMPIIPYGYTNAQNSAKGAAHYANNEAANEIIRTFADGQRVILVDVRSQFMNADGTYKGEMYVQLAGGDFPDMFLHLTPKAYEEILAPAIANAMAAAGASSVALPAIGSAAAQVNGTSATVTLSNVSKGTDKDGHAATSYTISYKLDANAEVSLSAAETGTSASVQFDGLADGWHTCAVWVSSDGVVKSSVKRVKFLVDSQANAVGWKVAPMDATGSAFRSDGTQVFARGYTGHTVNGVSFSAGFPSSDQASVSPSSYSGDGWMENNPVFNGGWVWTKSDASLDIAFTLKGLTVGKKYLVQILAANHWNNSSTTISAGDLVPFEATKQNDYKCGAVISRVFEATGAQETVTVTFATSGSKCLVKAIQLRELGEGGGGVTGGGESGGEADGGETGGGEDLTGEFVKKTFIASNKLHLPYRVAAKADPNGGKVPVVVFLHGYGQCGVDNSFTINEMMNIKSYLDGAGGPGGYKLLVPQCPNDVKWAEFSMNSTTCTFQDKPSSALAAVFDLLDSYAAMADVDVNRIYVTGLSMGGHGTWDAICRRPDFFAAAMPCCGGGDPVCAADIAHVPVLAVHNRGDPTIPCEQTENMVTALRALGSDVIFEKLENNSHDAWTTCYSRTDDVEPGEPNHRFVWMFAQNRATNNRPKYPRITELTASPSGSSATISLAGVVLGTDADSVPATKYSVTYKLDGASSAVTALSDQAADSSFTLEGLADGNHTCEVTMTTDKGRTKTKSVVFYVNTSAVSDVWTSGFMDAEGNSFSTEGTLRYAYSTLGATVNGIRFERDVTLQGSSLKISFIPNIDSFDGSFMNEGVGGDFGLVLGNGWYWNGNESGTHTVTLTLSNLEGGRKYLVQFLSHSYWNNTTTVSANGCEPVHIHGDSAESGKYGALVTGVFTADSATKDVTITYQGGSGKMPFNAVQVRELPGGESGGGEPGPVDPEPTPTCSLTIPEKTGIVLKSVTTNGVAVAAVAGSYTIVSNTQVTVNFAAADGYEIVSGNPVVFALSGDKTFSDADYPAVRATGGNGSVEIGWTGGAADAEGTVFRTDGTLLYAYAVSSVTVNGIAFAADADLNTDDTAVSPDLAQTDGSSGSESVTGDFGTMLKNSWEWANSTSTLTITLKGLTAGKRYLVQVLAHNKWSDALISAGDLEPMAMRDTNKYGASLVCVFDATGETEDIAIKYSGPGGWRVLNAIQVRELPADVPVDPEAPVIGGEGVEVPFFVSSDKVAISIGNAAAGHRYGYRKSTTLAGLKDAPVVYFENSAAADGVLTLEIPKAASEPSCFYRIVVE